MFCFLGIGFDMSQFSVYFWNVLIAGRCIWNVCGLLCAYKIYRLIAQYTRINYVHMCFNLIVHGLCPLLQNGPEHSKNSHPFPFTYSKNLHILNTLGSGLKNVSSPFQQVLTGPEQGHYSISVLRREYPDCIFSSKIIDIQLLWQKYITPKTIVYYSNTINKMP